MAVVELQPALRGELKDPMGSLYTDAADLLAAAGSPVVAVGDMVTYHLLEAGRTPEVAVVDERTERSAVAAEVAAVLSDAHFDRKYGVDNPAATLTADLLMALADALNADGTTVIDVDGEEDLAALPAIVAAPDGTSVVYGQPGEGMVNVVVNSESRSRVRDLLSRLEGDPEELFSILGV